jgi:hypothetical protein
MAQRKRTIIFGLTVLCIVIALAGLSESGRALFTRIVRGIGGSSSESAVSDAKSSGDLEQRARTRHGWSSSVASSVITGRITYYNKEGQPQDTADFTLYRKYPDSMRAVIDRSKAVETIGFDQGRAWKLGRANVDEFEARDIRLWLRLWPDHLFTQRAAAAEYREVGSRVEDFRPASPFRPAAQLDPPVTLQQIRIEDSIGAPPDAVNAGDHRSVTYYVDQSTMLIRSARWLEPDDPRRTDRGAPKLDSRIDFDNWEERSGVTWPMQITRWLGGTVQFRIEVREVRVNEALTASTFEPVQISRK